MKSIHENACLLPDRKNETKKRVAGSFFLFDWNLQNILFQNKKTLANQKKSGHPHCVSSPSQNWWFGDPRTLL